MALIDNIVNEVCIVGIAIDSTDSHVYWQQKIVEKILGTDIILYPKLVLKQPVGHCQELPYASQDFIKCCVASENRSLDSVPGVSSGSDVIDGIYEGGFKVWECTHDLINLIERETDIVSGKSILDVSSCYSQAEHSLIING